MMKTCWRVLAAAAIAWPLMALAHAKLLGTAPAAGADLRVAPRTLTLTFNETVRLAVLKLSAGGRDIPVTLDRSAPAGAEVSVPLPVLGAGIYQVQWSALTVDDGHVVKGTFSFTVANPG
jgi:methionine-rich copper-binding protein CopC